ncbi:MAG: type II secretion system F family protein [Bacillota bacterium]
MSGRITFAVLAALFAFILVPRAYGKYRAVMRSVSVLRSLPSGTFSLLVVLRSGEPSILNALVTAASTSSQPIAGEFLKMAQEIRSGVNEEDAAENFGRRLSVREGKVLGIVLARYIRLGGGVDALALLEKVQAMLRNRDIVREAVKSGMSDILGDATISMFTALGFFAIGYLFAPDIYTNIFTEPTGRAVVFGGIIQAALVQIWVRWKCRKTEEELM